MIPIEQVIEEVHFLEDGGTLAVKVWMGQKQAQAATTQNSKLRIVA